MKNLIFIYLLFIALTSAKAQSAFSNVNHVTVNSVTFKCKTDTYSTDISNIQNITNGSWDNIPSNATVPDDCVFGLKGVINYAVVKDAFYSVFSALRRQQLIQEGIIAVLFIKPNTGAIQEIDFGVAKNTQITPQEIYKLELALKGKIMPTQPACSAMVFKSFPFSFDFKDHQL
jgi:hypothetical protein